MTVAMRFAGAVILVLVAQSVIAGHWPWPLQQKERQVSVMESTLRRQAEKKPLPEYPRDALSKNTEGLVVVEVSVNPNGRIDRLDILEASGQLFSASVQEALRQWMFVPVTISGISDLSRMEGKLTFYYRIVGGKGVVMVPSDPPRPVANAESSGLPRTTTDSAHQQTTEIDEQELDRLSRTVKPVVVDVRTRGEFRLGHRAGAVNIPSDELLSRAPFELQRSAYIVIDCPAGKLVSCRHAAGSLRVWGFSNIAILNP